MGEERGDGTPPSHITAAGTATIDKLRNFGCFGTPYKFGAAMDHHLTCVDKVLRFIAKEKDLRYERVRLSDLYNAIISLGFIQRIQVLDCPPNSAGLEALFYRARYDLGKREMAVICCANHLPESERRIRIAKELSHIFDRPDERTRTADQLRLHVSGLIIEKVMPELMLGSVGVDQDAPMLAIEMLIPFERRAIVMRGHVTYETVEQLAADCGVPLEYARAALDESYNEFIQGIRDSAGIKNIY